MSPVVVIYRSVHFMAADSLLGDVTPDDEGWTRAVVLLRPMEEGPAMSAALLDVLFWSWTAGGAAKDDSVAAVTADDDRADVEDDVADEEVEERPMISEGFWSISSCVVIRVVMGIGDLDRDLACICVRLALLAEEDEWNWGNRARLNDALFIIIVFMNFIALLLAIRP